MSRPEHLHCPNTAEGIRRINEEQDYYDRNPQEYEARERQIEEERQQEERMMAEQEREYERIQYERWERGLDF